MLLRPICAAMYAKYTDYMSDRIRPNTMPDEMKVELLRDLDGELSEMFAADAPPFPPVPEEEEEEEIETWPEANGWPETDPVLLMPFPHDGVYVKYLCAQIDLINMESDVYQNDMIVYNTAMADARAWWRRNHLPRRNHNWKVM